MMLVLRASYFLRRAAARPMRPMPKSAIVPGSGAVDVVDVVEVVLLLEVVELLDVVPKNARTSSKPSAESRPFVSPARPELMTMYR